MNVTSAQVQKILTGNHVFSMLGFSMLVTRLKGVYVKNPSPSALQNCVAEMNTFIHKYGAVMAADIATISKI